MIDRSQLRVDLPPIEEINGYTNVVLACKKPEFWVETNTYLPAWEVCNVVWYNKYSDKYLGWLALEDILPSQLL